jgi:DNA repair photolyase
LLLVRWDTIRISGRSAAPALFERNAVARTFDTPGFRGMTFFEVHARSVINRVPAASRVPFRWTINPYRGCSHACAYCVEGETPILMADGRTRPISDLRAGDAVYGTVRRGSRRRYAPTTVLAHWQTVKPAYLITLTDGTSLVASGDHRFLSDRGWKYVTGGAQGALRRPHLATGDTLMGVGCFADQPKDCAEYRRGYLCGMIRGDGSPGRYAFRLGEQAPVRLAPAGPAALGRAADYLRGMGVTARVLTAAGTTGDRREVLALRTGGCDPASFIEWLIRWPSVPSQDWRKGFLAGIFDAEGSYSRGTLRIPLTDREVTGWTAGCLSALGLAPAAGPARQADERGVIRVRGGLAEALRFFHTTDPANTSKRTIEGMAINSGAHLGVESIRPLGLDVPMFDITTGTGDFIADGVVSHNCFARQSHTYLDLDAGHDFDSKIVVKVNAPERVRAELAAPRWQGEHIAMGTNVDCYQRAEGRYRLMPGILAALRDAANPFSILTKGTLILRDAGLLAEAAEVTDVGLAVSVGSVDEDLWRVLEPGTPSPHRRLDVCAALTARGLGCTVLMGPVVPFLSDSPAQLAATVRQVAAAGATSVSPIVLHLRPGAREWFGRWLGEHHPDLVPRYQALYGSGAYAPRAYQQRVTEQVRALARQYRVGQQVASQRTGSGRAGERRPARARFAGAPARPAGQAVAPVQLTLL